MSQDIYVTEKDKIIISDILFYMQNKLQSIPHDEIIQNCDKFYHDEKYIWQQKEIFFKAIDVRPLKCRTSDKKIKDLYDILNEMKNRDARGEWQPVCVAIEYSNMPHSEDGSISNSQIHGTLLNMRKDFVTQENLVTFKHEIMSTLKMMSNMISRPLIPSSPFASPSRRVMPTPSRHLTSAVDSTPVRLDLGGVENQRRHQWRQQQWRQQQRRRRWTS